jgi:hypothetical protein
MKIKIGKRIGILILLSTLSRPLFAQGTESVVQWAEFMETMIPVLICSVIGLILQALASAFENKGSGIFSMLISLAIIGMTVFVSVKCGLSIIMILISLLSLLLSYKSYKSYKLKI